MTLRNSFRKRPPFPFSHRARVNQLVCDPRPYVRAWAEDGRPLWAPCLAWSPGPVELASTGDGSYQTLFGENWLAQVCQDGTWVLYKRIDNETLEVTEWDVVPPTVSITARHLTLAFDQGARPSVAWEDENGIRLREFNETTGQYHFIGPFEGVDPVLLNDAQVNRHVPDSDVVLFYLSTDRTKLLYRIQSENFAVENEHYAFDAPVVLDAVDTGRYRYQLKPSNEHGTVFGTLTDFDALVSDLYPVFVDAPLDVTTASLEGMYRRGAWRANPAYTVDVTTTALEGAYQSSILRHDVAEGALLAVVSALEGGYEIAVLRANPEEGALLVEGEALEGEYALTVIRAGVESEAVLVTAAALEGAYGLP